MIRAEIKNIRGNAGDAIVHIAGTSKVICNEYKQIVKAMQFTLNGEVGEKKAGELLIELTKEALEADYKRVTQEDLERKFEEIKNDPEKVAKLLKTLFED